MRGRHREPSEAVLADRRLAAEQQELTERNCAALEQFIRVGKRRAKENRELLAECLTGAMEAILGYEPDRRSTLWMLNQALIRNPLVGAVRSAVNVSYGVVLSPVDPRYPGLQGYTQRRSPSSGIEWSICAAGTQSALEVLNCE